MSKKDTLSSRLSGISFKRDKSDKHDPGQGRRPPTEASPSVKSTPKPVLLSLDEDSLEKAGGASAGHLATTLAENTLPLAVRLTKGFGARGSPLALKSGELLLLCCIVDTPIVTATFTWEKHRLEYRLPIHSKQLYEILPQDPSLDDKVFEGTKSLIDSKPCLPREVRIVDAVYSYDSESSQCQDEIITINRVEVQEHPERGRERVLIGYDDQDNEVVYPESLEMASYSTMIYPEPLLLSQILKHEPKRARLAERKGESQKDKSKQRVVTFNRYYSERQVMAIRSKDMALISIPIVTPLEFDIIDVKLSEIGPMLPAIFSRTNFTWCVKDLMQPRIAESFSAIPQPNIALLTEWSGSYEGQQWMTAKDMKSVDALNASIAQKIKEISILKRQLAVWTSPRPHVPARDPPETDGSAPPPLPPRESTVKNRRVSMPARALGGPLIPPKHGAGNNIYDEPRRITDSNNTDSNKRLEDAQNIIRQLKKELAQKNEEIFKLRSEERNLTEKHKKLEREKDGLQKSLDRERNEITRLQGMVDKLESGASVADISGRDGHIYATPFTDVGGRKSMTVKETVEFLKAIGLERYSKVFEEELITGAILTSLDEQIMMEDLGMRRLDARKLTTALQTNK